MNITMRSITSISEDEIRLFNEVQQEIACNVRRMMEALWVNWSHLGIDYATKSDRIRNLALIEKDLHRDVIQETEQKLKTLNNEVDKLKAEATQLGRYLSTDICIEEFTDDVLLSEYKKNLENEIGRYRKQVEQRKTTIKRLAEWQQDLCESLGVSVQPIKEIPLPSEEELRDLTQQLEDLQEERDKRMSRFLNYQKEIKDIMECLSLKPLMKFESLVVNSLSVAFKVTDRNMERLEELLQSMRDQMHETNNRVLELRERLHRAWECLEEDRMYRTNFLQANPGCGPATEKALREEIARCDHIKKQKIQVLIANMRTKIKLMWDQCLYSERQREEFVHYFQDIYSEDTLTLHELYLEDLNKLYNDHRLIYETVRTRKELWEKMSVLEVLANDKDRLKNRGGKLLIEEKQRKAIASRLPKIEAQLEEMVKQYEAATGKEFTVEGKPLLQIIEEDWEARKNERQNKMSARKQALTPSTQLLCSLAVSPLGKRNRTAAGLPNMADKNQPHKRPLVTASASKVATATSCNRSALKRAAMTTTKKDIPSTARSIDKGIERIIIRQCRRMSGRLAALAATTIGEGKERPRRKLNYNEYNTPRITVNGSILKHKRKSNNRRSSTRRSLNASKKSRATNSSTSQTETAPQPPGVQVADSSILTSYTDFKANINESSRSSLVTGKHNVKPVRNIQPTLHEATPKKTPISNAFTPKLGKENIRHNEETPSFRTPLRSTRTVVKNEVFLTPRAPLSANKMNVPKRLTPHAVKTTPQSLPRQNTLMPIATNTSSNLSRSKSSHALRPRNFLI